MSLEIQVAQLQTRIRFHEFVEIAERLAVVITAKDFERMGSGWYVERLEKAVAVIVDKYKEKQVLHVLDNRR